MSAGNPLSKLSDSPLGKLAKRTSLLAGANAGCAWQSPACCAEVVAASRSDPGAVEVSLDEKYGAARYALTVSRENIQLLLERYASSSVLRFVEFREKASELQLFTVAFYQPFVVLDVEGGVSISVEELNGRLEVMAGYGDDARIYLQQYRASGEKRKTSIMQQPHRLDTTSASVTVRDLLNWISSPTSPAGVQEKGFINGFTSFLLTSSVVQQGSLVDFLADERPSNPCALSSAVPAGRTSGAEGYPVALHSTSEQISLIVVFSSDEFDSKPTWNVSLERWKTVADLQSLSEEVLGESLARLVSKTGCALQLEATIDEAGLQDGDTITAEFHSSN